MKRLCFGLAGAAAAVLMAVLPAAADSIPDLEHGRAQARAGRDVSDREADLLDRYGDQSGARGYVYEADDDEDDETGPYDEAYPRDDEPYRPRRHGAYYSPY